MCEKPVIVMQCYQVCSQWFWHVHMATCVSHVCPGCSYGDILENSRMLAALIKGLVGNDCESLIPNGAGCVNPAYGIDWQDCFAPGSTDGPRIAIMAGPGRQYVEGTWGAWMARCIAVPLCTSHPPAYSPATACMVSLKGLRSPS